MKISKYEKLQIEGFEGTIGEWAAVQAGTVGSGGNTTTLPRPEPSRESASTTSQPIAPPLISTAQAHRLWLEITSENQRAVVIAIVKRGGRIAKDELQAETKLPAEELRGVLSCVTRNAQRVTGDDDAKLIDYATFEDGRWGYEIAEPALTVLREKILGTAATLVS